MKLASVVSMIFALALAPVASANGTQLIKATAQAVSEARAIGGPAIGALTSVMQAGGATATQIAAFRNGTMTAKAAADLLNGFNTTLKIDTLKAVAQNYSKFESNLKLYKEGRGDFFVAANAVGGTSLGASGAGLGANSGQTAPGAIGGAANGYDNLATSSANASASPNAIQEGLNNFKAALTPDEYKAIVDAQKKGMQLMTRDWISDCAQAGKLTADAIRNFGGVNYVAATTGSVDAAQAEYNRRTGFGLEERCSLTVGSPNAQCKWFGGFYTSSCQGVAAAN